MNDKKDLSTILDEIIKSGDEIIKSGKNILSCAEVVIKSLNDMKAIFSVSDKTTLPQKKESAPLPSNVAEAKKYSFEDVRGIMAGLSGQGKKAEAKALLQKYGVSRLSDLNEKDYAAVAEEAKVIANG